MTPAVCVLGREALAKYSISSQLGDHRAMLYHPAPKSGCGYMRPPFGIHAALGVDILVNGWVLSQAGGAVTWCYHL